MSLGVAKLGDLRCGGHRSAIPPAGCGFMVQHPRGPGRGGPRACFSPATSVQSQALLCRTQPKSFMPVYPGQARTGGCPGGEQGSGVVEGGWRDTFVPGVLLAEMGAPKSLLMKVKDESEKGEGEGKGNGLSLDSPSRTLPLGFIIARGSSRLCALIFEFTFQPPLGGGKEGRRGFFSECATKPPSPAGFAGQSPPHPAPTQHGEFLNTQFTWNHFRLYLITESRTPIILGGLRLPRHFLKPHTFSVLSTPACPNPI